MAGLIKAWSFSRWKDYEQCPFRAKCKHVDRMKEPPSPAMERGSNIHKMAEDYTTGALKRLPKELKLFNDRFKALKKAKATVEQSWAFTRKWGITQWNDWQNCWLRVKVDAFYKEGDTLFVIDHKTGKRKEDHLEQLSLYALSGMVIVPEVKKVVTSLWYLDSGETGGEGQEFSDKEVPALKKDWEKKTRAMLSDTRFAPKPGYYCQWCPFSKGKGGPCKF
jgi:CRISPR/Cas system-associated exonuclease Cas4 (RecB family)